MKKQLYVIFALVTLCHFFPAHAADRRPHSPIVSAECCANIIIDLIIGWATDALFLYSFCDCSQCDTTEETQHDNGPHPEIMDEDHGSLTDTSVSAHHPLARSSSPLPSTVLEERKMPPTSSLDN